MVKNHSRKLRTVDKCAVKIEDYAPIGHAPNAPLARARVMPVRS
jgi:hypothetical protein